MAIFRVYFNVRELSEEGQYQCQVARRVCFFKASLGITSYSIRKRRYRGPNSDLASPSSLDLVTDKGH